MAVDRCGDDCDAPEWSQPCDSGRQPEAGRVEDHIGAALEHCVHLRTQCVRLAQCNCVKPLRLQRLSLVGFTHRRQHLGTPNFAQGQRCTAHGTIGTDH